MKSRLINSLFNGAIKVLISLTVLLVSCEISVDPEPEGSLQSYINEIGLTIQRDSLIACAGSGQVGILQDPSGMPVSVIFFPLEDISDIRYFETDSLPADFDDFTAYREQSLSLASILDGTLMKFTRPESSREVIGFVTFIRNNKLFISNRIHIKDSFEPTQYFSDDVVTDQQDLLMPRFQWTPTADDRDAIYFHVVSDQRNTLLSGTYTFENTFQFYNLDNVVLNITDPSSEPALEANTDYLFSVMGISIDNWINFLATAEFDTSED